MRLPYQFPLMINGSEGTVYINRYGYTPENLEVIVYSVIPEETRPCCIGKSTLYILYNFLLNKLFIHIFTAISQSMHMYFDVNYLFNFIPQCILNQKLQILKCPEGLFEHVLDFFYYYAVKTQYLKYYGF